MSSNPPNTAATVEDRPRIWAEHDCTLDHCYDDPRSTADIEREGYIAGVLGVSYDQCPYGRTHPDVRFSPWQRGRWKARGEWCDSFDEPKDWHIHHDGEPCWPSPDEELVGDGE